MSPSTFVCTSSHRRLVLGSVPKLTHSALSAKWVCREGFSNATAAAATRTQRRHLGLADAGPLPRCRFVDVLPPRRRTRPRPRTARDARQGDVPELPGDRAVPHPRARPSASPTASGAACPSPSANCCSSGASAAPPEFAQEDVSAPENLRFRRLLRLHARRRLVRVTVVVVLVLAGRLVHHRGTTWEHAEGLTCGDVTRTYPRGGYPCPWDVDRPVMRLPTCTGFQVNEPLAPSGRSAG